MVEGSVTITYIYLHASKDRLSETVTVDIAAHDNHKT